MRADLWTPEQDGVLVKMWKRGEPGSAIAAEVGRSMYGVYCRAKLLDMKPRPRGEHRKYARPGPIAKTPFTPSPPSLLVDPTPTREGAWEPLHGSTPISLMDLPDRPGVACRWPVTGGYCGLPSGDRTYCPDHHHMAFRNPTEGEIRTAKSIKKMGHK